LDLVLGFGEILQFGIFEVIADRFTSRC